MGFTVNFTDNQSITSNEINSIASGIDNEVTGISFTDDTLYGVDELNSISKSLITKGVTQGLDVLVNGDDIIITSGSAYFDDGKKLVADSDGITLKREENTFCYVWLSNDISQGIVSAKATAEEPSGDYVLLATVSASGIVTPKKEIALMKNSSLMPNYYERITQFISIAYTKEGTTLSLDVGKDFRRMIILTLKQPIYVDWDANEMYQTGKYYKDVTDPFDTLITVIPYLTIQFISYENNILTYKAHCSTAHGSVYGDLVIDCM